MSRAKRHPRCLAPGCQLEGSYARGFCQLCYGQFRLACKKNSSWQDEDERNHVQHLLTHPEIKPFEWDGDEDALAALVEQQEREKQANDSKVEETENE